jgi:YCII-related domain
LLTEIDSAEPAFPSELERGGLLMPKYVIAYHGGEKFGSPQDRAAHMAKWKAWVAGLGDAVVNPGTPLGKGKLVSSSGVSEAGVDRLTGFSIVTADSMGAALDMAQRCPFLDIGTIEVAEVMEMK